MTAEPHASTTAVRRCGWPELAVVGTIIFLILLLLPAITSGSNRPRRDAEVRADMSRLEDAIMQFKVTYGVEPPSGIVLYADQAGWNQDRRSRGLIRQLWPKFDFATCGGLENVPPNGITLNGSECLVFFLGGVARPGSGEMYGFSKNPAQPFSTTEPAREGPFFEFRGHYSANDQRWFGRLVDQDRDGFPEYLDPLPRQTQPYLYVSSYSGKGYRVEDLGGAMRDVYRDRDGVAHKPNGIQIISPGADGKYGFGGLFDPEHANAILASERIVERDNLTNFMAGTLCELPHPQMKFLITLGIVNLVVFLVIAVTCKLRWGALLLLIVLVIVNSPLLVPALFGIS